MELNYDKNYDLLYICFDGTEQKYTSKPLQEQIQVDVNKETSKIIGLEIHNVSQLTDAAKLVNLIDNLKKPSK